VSEWASQYEGNEREAKEEVEMGRRMGKPDIATPAGIRQAYPIHPRRLHT